jgi:hypothetical protein
MADENKTSHQFSFKDFSIPIGVVGGIILTVASIVWSVSNQITELKVFLAENMATQAELAEVEERIIDIERNGAVLEYRVDQLEVEHEEDQSE